MAVVLSGKTQQPAIVSHWRGQGQNTENKRSGNEEAGSLLGVNDEASRQNQCCGVDGTSGNYEARFEGERSWDTDDIGDEPGYDGNDEAGFEGQRSWDTDDIGGEPGYDGQCCGVADDVGMMWQAVIKVLGLVRRAIGFAKCTPDKAARLHIDP
eukprot:1139381-Pelagomonas_calceolata.AAC.4